MHSYARMYHVLVAILCNIGVTQIILALKTLRDNGKQLRLASM